MATKEYNVKYNQEHREELNKKAIEYYWSHRQEKLDYAKAYEARTGNSKRYVRTLRGKYVRLIASAKYRDIPISITFEEYCTIVSNPCFYCKGSLPTTGHGLDRLNSMLGYTPENAVPCCKRDNVFKGMLESLGFVYPDTVSITKEIIHKLTEKV